MHQYHAQLQKILDEGVASTDRTGTGTLSYFGMQARYPMSDGFPLVTTKKIHIRSVVHELLWMLSGETNIRYLKENGVSIWDEWADEAGELGPVYGQQWRKWPTTDGGHIDQVTKLIEDIKATPDSRRLIVSAWNPEFVSQMALPPCHSLWQVRIAGGKLHLHLFQRSNDMLLGAPFNVSCYALILHMLAHVTGYEPGDFVHSISDAHIYLNHIEQVKMQLARKVRPLPRLKIKRRVSSIFDFKFDDFEFEGYDPHPAIKAPVAV